MKFGIVVSEGPCQRQSADSAFHFVCAALAKGHEVIRVFFYHDGVHAAASACAPPQDERNVAENWTALAEEHGLDLVVCVAAAQRRGVVDEEAGMRLDQTPAPARLAPNFRAAGLGQLIECGIDADRLLEF